MVSPNPLRRLHEADSFELRARYREGHIGKVKDEVDHLKQATTHKAPRMRFTPAQELAAS